MNYVFYPLIMLHDDYKITKEVWLRHGCSCLTAMATFQQLGQPSFVAPRRMHEEVHLFTAPPPFHSPSNSLRVFHYSRSFTDSSVTIFFYVRCFEQSAYLLHSVCSSGETYQL
jgi:hypothetical protein